MNTLRHISQAVRLVVPPFGLHDVMLCCCVIKCIICPNVVILVFSFLRNAVRASQEYVQHSGESYEGHRLRQGQVTGGKGQSAQAHSFQVRNTLTS